MGCSSSFHAAEGFMLNLGSLETDLGSGGLRVRHGGYLATCQMQKVGLGVCDGFGHNCCLVVKLQQKFDSCGNYAKLQKIEPLWCGKSHGVPAVITPGNTHSVQMSLKWAL